MREFEIGDLVRDRLNQGRGAYGLGVVVRPTQNPDEFIYNEAASDDGRTVGLEIDGLRYDVYFTKFERTITFHAEYLEKV